MGPNKCYEYGIVLLVAEQCIAVIYEYYGCAPRASIPGDALSNQNKFSIRFATPRHTIPQSNAVSLVIFGF